jgi:hypothetical protein
LEVQIEDDREKGGERIWADDFYFKNDWEEIFV